MALQQNKVIRAITFSDFYAHTSPLFKSRYVLKIKDIFNPEIGSLMWDFDHHSLPDSFASMFTRRNEIHNLNLRDQTKINFTPRSVLIIDMVMISSHTAVIVVKSI